MATETKSSVVKVKPSGNQDGSSVNKKKVVDSNNKIAKTEVKAKTTSSSSKSMTKTTSVKPREKKVFSLPGQKYEVPEEREPLRIFYESLSEQIPSSEMAEFWMMEHGLLSPERAKKAYEKKQRKQKELRTGTPIKSPPPPPSRPESSTKNGDVKAKKRIVNDNEDDDDNVVLNQKKRKG
ncbi:hypothetical protein LguiB_027924 [Lonicera macranthoides]